MSDPGFDPSWDPFGLSAPADTGGSYQYTAPIDAGGFDPNFDPTSSVPGYLNTNPYGSGALQQIDTSTIPGYVTGTTGGSDFTVNDLAQWLKLGLITYAQFQQVEHGQLAVNSQGQLVPPPAIDKGTGQPINGPDQMPANGPDTSVHGDASAKLTPFDWHQLTNFATPYPYAAGAALVFGVWLIGRHGGRGR